MLHEKLIGPINCRECSQRGRRAAVVCGMTA